MKTKEKTEVQKTVKKKGRGKKALKVLCVILAVIVLLGAVAGVVNTVGNKGNIKKAQSFEQVKIEEQLVPEKDENGYWTFTTDREFRVMQLTDVHIGGGFMSDRKSVV